MNKILANMMLHCSDKISTEQIEVLQTHKDSPSDFDVNTKGYFELLNFNLDKYAVNPQDEGAAAP